MGREPSPLSPWATRCHRRPRRPALPLPPALRAGPGFAQHPRVARHVPHFFLEEAPVGARLRLGAAEAEHARVLRLKAGAPCVGLDGQGGRWELEVAQVAPKELLLDLRGPRQELPAPGQAGAALPWIEMAIAWPRRNRAEPMLSSLVQLGVAAIRPLEAQHRGPQRDPNPGTGRALRRMQEDCKQCGRAWLPVIDEALTPAALAELRAETALAVLDPGGMAFDTWLRSLVPSLAGPGTQERPISLAIGPEGGFDDDERAALLEAGATRVSLGPHILRIETAAVAAASVAVTVLRTGFFKDS